MMAYLQQEAFDVSCEHYHCDLHLSTDTHTDTQIHTCIKQLPAFLKLLGAVRKY